MSEEQAPAGRKFNIPPEIINGLLDGSVTLGQAVGLGRERLYEIARVGYHLLESGRLEDAKTIYRGLVAASPYDSVFHCHLAAVHHRLGELDEALEQYTEALRFNIANTDAMAGRGEVYIKRGQIREGIADLNEAVRLDPQEKRDSTVRARAILVALQEAAKNRAAQAAENTQKPLGAPKTHT
jgi:tetratricopeptide (TPR) repeat protein